MADPQNRTYLAVVGLDLPKIGRVEPGAVFTAAKVVKDFLEQGLVIDATDLSADDLKAASQAIIATEQ